MRRTLLLTALMLVGCTKGPDTATPSSTSPATGPTTVSVVSPKSQTLNWTVDQPATAVAFESAPLVAKLPGYVAKVHVDLGDMVKAGQKLAELAIPELIQELAQKRAMVDQTKAQREQAKQSVVVAQARIEVAEAGIHEAEATIARATAEYDRWQSEMTRVDGLVARKVIDAQTKDETTKQFTAAKAMREEANARVVSAKAGRSEAMAMQLRAKADESAASATVAVAEAEVKRIEALLSYTTITAPFDGIITQRSVHPGHFIQPAGSLAGKQESLFVVVKAEIVRIAFDVPESAAGQVGIGSPAIVKVPALQAKEFTATITRTAGVLSGDSRTLRAEIDLPNADGLVKPGMYCSVRITGQTPQATILPVAAIQYADETTYVYEVVDGKIVKQRVRIGRIDSGMVEVLGKKRLIGTGDWRPLTPTDRFVNANLGALSDGQAVTLP
jgi:RND family efflux transporter MFP subunit